MIKAPTIFRYQEWRTEINQLEEESLVYFNKIFDLLDQIQSNDDERHILLWLSAPRGTVSDFEFDDKEEMMEYFDVDKIEDAEVEFLRFYPRETYWFRLQTVHNDVCKFIKFDNFVILIRTDGEKEKPIKKGNPVDFLEWLYAEVREKIEEIKNGTYHTNVERELPYEQRFGVIPRKKYWELVPSDREYEIGKLTTAEIESFFKLYQEEGEDYLPENRIKDMTFNQYFQFAIWCYEDMGLALYGNTLKDKFEHYGEDFGGRQLDYIDAASVQAFEEFFTTPHRYGEHPWGIWRGSSRSRVMLWPHLDENGYYFVMSGNPNWSCYEVVKMYLTLKEHRVPVCLRDFKSYIAYLNAEDDVGIVPFDYIPVYCQLHFPGRHIEDFRHFNDEIEGMFEEIEWLEQPDYVLKNGKL